jgi:hypothetical protein
VGFHEKEVAPKEAGNLMGDFQRHAMSLQTFVHFSKKLLNEMLVILNMCLTENISQEILHYCQ